MSFYRNLAAVVAIAFVSTSVLAADAANTDQNAPAANPQAMQIANAQDADAAKNTSGQQEKVNINTASLQDLMNVKGMNRLKAKNIVRYRNKHLFKSLDELSSVKGFKKMDKESLKSIQDQMSIN